MPLGTNLLRGLSFAGLLSALLCVSLFVSLASLGLVQFPSSGGSNFLPLAVVLISQSSVIVNILSLF